MQFYSAFALVAHYIPWPFSLMQDPATNRIYIQDLVFPQRLYIDIRAHISSPHQVAVYLHEELYLYTYLIPAWHGRHRA